MKKITKLLIILVLTFFQNMEGYSQVDDPNKVKYLALGDSYTIGESVEESQRWPIQLTERLKVNGVEFLEPRIIAKTGWTTDELTSAIEEASFSGRFYDLVSLLIGVNNQYRGYNIEVYRNEFAELVFKSIQLAGNDKSKVFILSIPDYGVTPFASEKDPEKIAKEIDEYNKIGAEVAKEFGVRFYDITKQSRMASSDQDLTAEDGLHPSGKMYSSWVDIIKPDILKMIM